MGDNCRSAYDNKLDSSYCLCGDYVNSHLLWYPLLVYALTITGSSVIIVQVTDLHVPNEHSPGYKNIRIFNDSALAIVQPDAVLVTGDMTLGYRWKFISRDQQQQWELYDNVWKLQQVVPRTLWFDLPGNHDFTVDGSRIADHSSQGNSSRVRLDSVKKENQTVCLLGIDFSYRPRIIQFVSLVSKIFPTGLTCMDMAHTVFAHRF